MLIPTCIHLKSDRQFRCLAEGIHFRKSHAIFFPGKDYCERCCIGEAFDVSSHPSSLMELNETAIEFL